MMMQAQVEPGNPWLNERATLNTWIVGRLKPGVSTAQAEANLNAIAADLARQYPWPNEGLKFKLARPGLVGDTIRGPVKAFTAGVLALAGLVLLAACANLASLLTARTADRRREIAIRLSIGAGRGRIVRQLLTESLLLSMAGGLAGYALAIFLSSALSAWQAPMDFPVRFDVNADWRVFLFAFAISTMAGVLFGLAPARHVSRTDMNAVLKGADGGLVTGRRFAFRDILVALQVALCFVLVSGCLLSLRGLQHALTMPLGFQPRGVAVAAFELGLAGYSKPDGENFQRRALDALKQLPGVSSAAYSNSVPLSIDQSHNSIYPEDQPNRKPLNARNAVYYQVSPDFFRTMQIRLVAGRDFNWRDDPQSPLVAIVNQAFARKILYSDNPVGKRFRFGPRGPLAEVIGVVNDGKYESLTESPRPVVFKPILQSYNSTTTLLVRSALPEGQMVAQMRRAVAQLDPGLPLYGTGSLQQMLGFAFFPSQAAAVALSAFGVLAIVLAATGINGLVAYAVSRRVREIGIRMAIGARPSEVLRLVLARMAALLMAGAILGLALAIAAGQVLASVIYQASPRDPLALAAVALTMSGIGILSCWAPARRALRIDPMVALRYE
jgi:predicted permease